MSKILFWLGLFAMSFLLMAQPVHASGTVAMGHIWYVGNYSADTNSFKSTPQLACQYVKETYWADSQGWGGYYWEVTSQTSTTFTCSVRTASSFAFSGGGGILGDACPANSTGTTTCTCTDPYVPNAGATACEMPACPALDTPAGAYWISTGTLPNSIYTVGFGNFCSAGCQTVQRTVIDVMNPTQSDAGAWKLVNGVKQYYSYRNYYYTGQTCSSGDAQPVAAAVPATDTCGAGQSIIQMGKKVRCLNPSTGEFVNTNSASAIAAAKTLADAKAAAQIAAAASAVAAAGGSATDVAAAQSVAAGVAAVGGGAPTNNGFAPDDPMNAFCVDNPEASICKEQTAGAKTVGTAALSGLYTNGDLIAGKTVSSVIDGFKTRVLASGIGAAAGGFFTVSQVAGACPAWTADVPMFGSMTFDFYCQATFQNLLPWIRGVLLLIFSVVAFRIAIL